MKSPCLVRCQTTDTNGVREHACGAMWLFRNNRLQR